MFVIPLPSPLIIPPTSNDSEIFTEPLKDVNTLPVIPVSNTLNSPFSDIDAVYEPLSNLFNVSAKLAISISVKHYITRFTHTQYRQMYYDRI
jgi:Membrane GTPase LepA